MANKAELIADERLVGVDLCTALSAWADAWLAQLFAAATAEADPGGLALVAVGGYGRGELSPQSDLDVLLVHDPSVAADAVSQVAEGIWYPIWDAGVKLGHAVRTVDEAVSLASGDLDTATSLLDCRHVAGDTRLTTELSDAAVERWRKKRRRRLAELSRSVSARHEGAGEVAFLLEPDLKGGRGGLRDVHALRWAQAAGATLPDGDASELAADYETLLAVRVELHRRTRRPGDVLLLEEQDAIAAAFGVDADELMRRVATAARAIAWRSDAAWRAIDAEVGRSFGRTSRAQPLGDGLVLRGDTVHLAEDVDLADASLPLRAAAAAAGSAAVIDRTVLERLATCPPLPEPWPDAARAALVDLLAAGHAAIPTVEALDHHGIWTRVLPEWEAVHSKPQRNAYHRFTVDRHLLEAAANAAALVDRVDRRDLLLVGTLLHDIGKGRPGDHTEVGIEMVQEIGSRMGFPPADVDDLVQMVRHHLLLPDVATRRDLDDEGTLRLVADAVGSGRVLSLLHALTEADSLATGPAAWGDWKAGLVAQLVERAGHLIGGGEAQEVTGDGFPSAEHRALMATGQRHVLIEDDVLTVVDVDRPGLFSRVAGVLALHGAGILAASAHSAAGGAVAVFRVVRPARRELPWDRISADLDRALDGRLAVSARLAERIGTYRLPRPRRAHPVANKVVVDNDVSVAATVVEVHTEDRMGVLYRITAAIAELGLDIRSARVQTLGEEVVDAFYLLDPQGRKLTDRYALEAVEVAVLHALDTAP
ncbi:[protein-PII] uridylyltransferase [Actinomarinicola tropica]|uniref:Bifunctional uridylyltransferase/uridylyl-removing enzyme n=1 Tax=Actinomarinicola tropica TaxID=2789776 RepID=A0A5Q2RPB6_9ACTN|nr:[protein-PII] uridylyltransferase [Actinomarinicola tropica]QGG96431.1 [protein-PII] uridylyltransferase [Actinomarinicola tropica]